MFCKKKLFKQDLGIGKYLVFAVLRAITATSHGSSEITGHNLGSEEDYKTSRSAIFNQLQRSESRLQVVYV